MVTVLCNDSEIEFEDGEICEICGLELEEFDQVTGTGIHGYYHWTCVTHVDWKIALGGSLLDQEKHSVVVSAGITKLGQMVMTQNARSVVHALVQFI